MASADKSLDPENFDDNRMTDASSSCLNDPNYAIICVFLQKFGSLLKIEHPDFLRLQKMIENTDEVHDELKQFFVRLLRKIRKSVQPDKLDSALAKFCYTYSAQDAWEIERFGYKRASLAVKLRILKEVLESQFDKNPNFRTSISGQSATELRSQPLGKDRLGNAYWSTVDEQCNLRIYQEHLDEEIWKVVATNRDEMVKLISCLRSNELVMPSMIGLIDEDSSSNSMTPKVDALQTENGTITNGNGNGNGSDEKNVPCLKIKLNPGGGESTVEQIPNGDNKNGAKNQNNSSTAADKNDDDDDDDDEEQGEEEEEDLSAMSDVDELSQAASESSATTAGTKSTETQGSKRISLMASKPPSNANKLKLRIHCTDKKVLKRNLEVDSKTAMSKSKRPMIKKHDEEEDSEYGSEEMSDEMSGDDMSSDDESSVGPAIEEPTMYVHGTGSGVDNKCENMPWPHCEPSDEIEVSEAIEEDVFYVCGEGNGYDCDVGNNDVKTTESSATTNTPTEPATTTVQSKPMFFFGQAGCLKLSPMKTPGSNDNASAAESSTNNTTENVQSECVVSVESEKLENEKIISEKSQSEEILSAEISETIVNDTDSVASDVNIESVTVENVTNNDETDRVIALGNQTLPVDVPINNVPEKIESIESTSTVDSDLQTIETETQEQSMQIDTNDSNILSKAEQSPNIEVNVSDAVLASPEQPEQPEQSVASPIATAINEIPQDNNESNSSVALESLSVREDVERIEPHESPAPIESETVTTESQLLTEKFDEKEELNENSDEKQGKPTPKASISEVECDELSSKEDENEPLQNIELEKEKSNNPQIENQSSVSDECAPCVDTEKTSENSVADASVDIVPIENQIPIQNDSSKNVDIEAKSEQPDLPRETTITADSSGKIESSMEPDYSSQVPVIEEVIVPKKAYICGPETQETEGSSSADSPIQNVESPKKTPQIEQEIEEIEPTNTMDCSSNQDAKTETIGHGLNEPISNESNTIKMKCASPVQDVTKKIPSVEITSEMESSQITPTNDDTVLPESVEKLNEPQTKDLVNEPVGTKDLSEVPELTEAENIVTEIVSSKVPEPAPREPIASEPSVSFELQPEMSKDIEIKLAANATDVFPPDAIKSIESANEITEITEPESAIPEKNKEITSQKLLESLENIEIKNTEPVAYSSPLIEKRKSIEQISEPSECKKVCEEKISSEAQRSPKVDVNIVAEQGKTEIPMPINEPMCSEKHEDIVHHDHQSSDEIEVKNLSIGKLPADIPTDIVAQEKTDQSLENRAENLHESSEIEQSEVCPQLEQKEQIIAVAETISSESIIETAKTETAIENTAAEPKSIEIGKPISEKVLQPLDKVELPSTTEIEKEEHEIERCQIETKTTVSVSVPAISKKAAKSTEKVESTPSVVPQLTQSTRLRNRKRRISTEKVRHSSESDDNAAEALIESALSPDASSDEQVGGKRIKMRPKVTVRRTTRRSVEQKRNIKDTDWSSDENEKPNAKRATSDNLTKERENSKPIAKADNKIPVEDVKPIAVEVEYTSVAKVEAQKETTETKVKVEEKEETEEPTADQQSEEEKATPTRRPGRPARRGRKPGPKPKAKPKAAQEVKSEKIKGEKDETEKTEQNEPGKEEQAKSAQTTETPTKPETRRKKRSILGLDIAEVETIQAAADSETPVRQSRRIAQIKIREEADRRKAEEIALQKMKEASEKKKKGAAQKESASEEENSESEAKMEKKKRRKKGNKDRPWQTDSEVDSSEREEEDVYEHEDVERLPPLGSDHEFSPESDIEDESQIVPTKRARTARKDKAERREESSEEEEDIHACQKCSKSDHPEWILLCDQCDKGYHCSCLIPVLFVIPEGNWFCPPCQQEKLIAELESKLIEFDNLVKQKEVEEAQRQRLLLTTISEANVIEDSKRDRQRARAAEFGESEGSDDGSTDGSSSEEESENTRPAKKSNHERRTRSRPTRQQRHISESSEHSSSDNSSDNEPIYKLRKRRQAAVSYRFNEYDELINRAIKKEMDEVAGAGNLGRGKDITTIMEADKEEKRLKKLEQQQKERELAGETNEGKENDDSYDDQPLKIKENKSDGSDSEPIRPKAIKRGKNAGRKKKKLNSLDVDSEEDADSSDDDFNLKGSSDSEDEEDDSTQESESSIDSIVKKRGKNRGISTRRSVRERKKRYDADFIDDSSFDDEDNVPLVKKKKKKVESDFSDFDGSSEELDEEVDSEDLCDDSTDSDRSWGKRKSKKPASKGKEVKAARKKKPEGDRAFKGKTARKKPKLSDDDDDDDDDQSDDDGDEILPKSRRTRGKKLPYLLDDDFDSSDDGIKPGVKRPDTPPEERAAFIKKQEEIKRMLAEKRDESLEKIPPPVKGSLSTIPPQIIQTAKALDVDLKKSASLNKTGSDNDSNGFDDDLPEDFDPEDMDEDAIAKMMEEEEFAQQQLKLAGETIRSRKLKDTLSEPMIKKDNPSAKLTIETTPSVIMQPTVPPSLVSPLPMSTSQLTIPDIPPSMYTAQFPGAHSKMPITPKKRGRKIKDDISPIVAKESTPPHPHIQSQHQQQQQAVHVQQSSQLPHRLPTHPLSQPPLTTPIQMPSIVPPNKANPLLNIPSVLQQTPAISQLFTSPTIQHTSSVIAHASVIQQQLQQQQQPPPPPQQHQQRVPLPPMSQSTVSTLLGLGQNRDPIIPSTVLDVQNTRLLDPSELAKPPDDLLDPATKKRARRKKVTPTRDSLITSPSTVSPSISQPIPVTIPNIPNVSKPPTSILSERLQSGNSVEKQGLSIATPPQLYSPSSRSQASVITRLSRPAQRQPFPIGQSPPQRYYAPNTSSIPTHSSIPPSTGSHSRPYHTSNVTTVTSGPRPPPLVPPTHTSGHLPHPMYLRGQPSIYGGYPNIQPPPMHRSLQSIGDHATNTPQNFTAGPYQNIPFGSYYAAAAAAERRSGAIIGTFEPFDNKNPSSHDRLPAYAHPGLGLAALASRNSAAVAAAAAAAAAAGGPGSGSPSRDDRTGSAVPGMSGAGSTSEFSGLVSYFSSQQDDLDP